MILAAFVNKNLACLQSYLMEQVVVWIINAYQDGVIINIVKEIK